MKYKFKTVIKKVEDKDATYIEVPFDVEKEFNAKRVKVKVKFDGYDYRGSIVNMGLSCYMIGITKAIRTEIGKQPGDTIQVELEKDEDLREIKLPSDFEKMLKKNKEAYQFFYSLSYSNQRKYYLWLTSAKKEETRIARMDEALIKLANKIKL
ncbi:MAG: DUF1905 domain-containing protein [Anaerorhabdus sp.]